MKVMQPFMTNQGIEDQEDSPATETTPIIAGISVATDKSIDGKTIYKRTCNLSGLSFTEENQSVIIDTHQTDITYVGTDFPTYVMSEDNISTPLPTSFEISSNKNQIILSCKDNLNVIEGMFTYLFIEK